MATIVFLFSSDRFIFIVSLILKRTLRVFVHNEFILTSDIYFSRLCINFELIFIFYFEMRETKERHADSVF